VARGKARFRGSPNVGALGVSFFGPFYGDYNILALDGGYRYALIGGGKSSFLWILSREPVIPPEIKAKYLDLAKGLSYEVDRLTWVKQD